MGMAIRFRTWLVLLGGTILVLLVLFWNWLGIQVSLKYDVHHAPSTVTADVTQLEKTLHVYSTFVEAGIGVFALLWFLLLFLAALSKVKD